MSDTPATPENPLPARLAAWQARAGLSPAGLAALIGVPVYTYRKWADGTRRPDAAAMRLIDLTEALQALAPDILAALPAPAPVAVAPGVAPGLAATDDPRGRPAGRRRGRSTPTEAQVPPVAENGSEG